MFDRFWGRGKTFATREAVVYLFRSFTFLGMNPPKNNRTLYFLYAAGIGVIYAIYGTSTFLTSMASGQPPFSFYIPFMDWRNSRFEYVMQVTFELIMLFYLLYYQVANDCYAVIYICIIRAHMQILVNRVRCLGKQPDKSGDDNFNELMLCISDHQCLLDLLETISPIISVTIIQFLITAAILCTTMMNIFLFADTTERIGSIFYLLAVLVQTFPCCYEASSLMEDSDQLPLAIFQCNWMHQDKCFRKVLIFFMQRAQHTMTLTAMKLFPINLNTNLSIAKFSFSLYTLIKEMDFGRNFAKK